MRQEGNTAEMNWDMHYLVADLARTITLLPGDMVFSGTPAGSRPGEPGDVVTVEVEGLGALTNTVVAGPGAGAGATVAPSPASRRRSSPPPSGATGSSAASARRGGIDPTDHR